MADYDNKIQTELAGLAKKDPKARNELKKLISPLIDHHVERYFNKSGPGLDVEQLRKAAWRGFDQALEKFDPYKGYSIGTQASWWIQQCLTKYVEGAATKKRS